MRSAHDGYWIYIEDSPNGVVCHFCGGRCHSYWAWFATTTKFTTTWCTSCVDELVSDVRTVEAFA
jgi:hypothetical protein